MTYFAPQNPGIGGLDELTPAEEAFLTSFAGLSFSDGDVLTISGGVPVWAPPSAAGGTPGGSSGDIQYNNAGSFGGSYLKQGTNVIEQLNSTNSQSLRVYKTYTDSSNYERIAIKGTSTSGWLQVAAETAGTGTDNIGIALTPAGTGALSAHVADSTAAGGNARGANAVDFQTLRVAATQVASGGGAAVICGGENNTASGTTSSVFGGTGNVASGTYSTAIGGGNNVASGTGASALGIGNLVSGNYSWSPGGLYASTRSLLGAYAYASGRRSATGDAQVIGQPVRKTTTATSAATLTSDGGAASTANTMVLPNNSSAGFVAKITARNSANVGSGYWEVRGTVQRGANAAATALVGATTITTFGVSSTIGSPTVDVVADTTNGGPVIQVTPANTDSTYWVANLELIQAL